MYEGYYGFRELPFELTPNPRYLYLTPRHREALSNLQYGLAAAKAVTLLLGEAGTGKTTLLKAALDSELCRHVRALHLTNPALTRNEFVQTLARGFGLSAQAAASKAVLLAELEPLLQDRRARGEITALIVDEAQSLSLELLEEIRLLANIESETEKFLPLVLVGQPELGNRLEDPCLRQMKQRVSLRCEISPFNLDETAAYIFTRVSAAGGAASDLFTREAVTMIHEYSGGIPRTISVICDNALVTSVALARHPVDREIVLEVVNDFRLHRDGHENASVPVNSGSGVAPLPTKQAASENDSEQRRKRVSETIPQRLFARLVAKRPDKPRTVADPPPVWVKR